MAERSFAREVEDLKLGNGDIFRGEGILAITKALLQSGVGYVGGYQGAPISHLMDVLADAQDILGELGVHFETSASEAAAGFFRLQHELFRALHEANGIDLARVKVANPVSKWFKMSLGQEFGLTAAHERRHLWQASRVRARLSSRVAA